MKYAAIVLSAGRGSRMKSKIQKQYMLLEGKPVLYYTLKAFEESAVEEIVLVTGEEDREYCRTEIVERYQFRKVKKIVAGGAERYDSVFYGLKALDHPDYVLIHDGARPFVNQEIIERSMDAVRKYQACVVGMPVKDTIKIANADGYCECTPDRSLVWQVQTPQTFAFDLIYHAYETVLAGEKKGITDDAMVIEMNTGTRIKMVEGSYENIKLTTPEDMEIASIFVKKRK